MAAATVNAAEALYDLERGWIGPALKDLIEYDIPRVTLIPFVQTFTIPAASTDDANDFVRLFQVPAGAYIWDWRSTPTDMDTGGPTLVYSILVAEESAPGSGSWTTRATLVSGSTNGQAAAGSDTLTAASIGKFIGGGSNYWVVWKVTTGATTPAAGTLKCAWTLSLGVINRNKRGSYLRDAGV
jgi:hypothetical protein